MAFGRTPKCTVSLPDNMLTGRATAGNDFAAVRHQILSTPPGNSCAGPVENVRTLLALGPFHRPLNYRASRTSAVTASWKMIDTMSFQNCRGFEPSFGSTKMLSPARTCRFCAPPVRSGIFDVPLVLFFRISSSFHAPAPSLCA